MHIRDLISKGGRVTKRFLTYFDSSQMFSLFCFRMMWSQSVGVFIMWVLCSVGMIPSTIGEEYDPKMEPVVHFLDGVITEMRGNTANISHLTVQAEQTSQQLNQVAETTTDLATHIAELEENLATCLDTSVEQSKDIRQLQQNMKILQERLDALDQTLLPTDGKSS